MAGGGGRVRKRVDFVTNPDTFAQVPANAAKVTDMIKTAATCLENALPKIKIIINKNYMILYRC